VSLNLSYNCLEDNCLIQLTDVIHGLPKLCKLYLASCKLTMKFFQPNRMKLADVLQSKYMT